MAASIQVHVPSHVHAYSQRAVRLHRIRASVHLTSAVRPFLVCVAEGDVPALVDVLGVVAALLSFSINTLCILLGPGVAPSARATSARVCVRGMLHPWPGQIRLKRNGFKTKFKS